MTTDELQALLQKRLDVLHIEIQAWVQSETEDEERRTDAIHALHGACVELCLMARYLGVRVRMPAEIANHQANVLYPSSENYEQYQHHMRGTCGCPSRKHQLS